MNRPTSASDTSPIHLASIVHITDTHFFVDRNGEALAASTRARLVRTLARLGVKDLDFASADMTERFSLALRRAVDLERSVLPPDAPLVAVHSGDTEAFGSPGGPHTYPGFGHLARILDEAGMGDSVVAVYGNHDVWPGSVALFGLNGPRHDTQKRTLADAVAMVGPLPRLEPLRFPSATGLDIVFVPLNSVNSHAVRGGIFAYGRMSSHPPSPASVLDVVDGYGLRPDDLNIAVMHHPLHFYRPLTLRDRLGVGHLDDAVNVAERLATAGIDLVLAGHRHRLDPAFGDTIDATHRAQWPLPAGLAQLVALSPTMATDTSAARADPEGSPRSGLCVYRVMATRGTISLQRLIHPTEQRSSTGPIVEGATVTGLSCGPRARSRRGPPERA